MPSALFVCVSWISFVVPIDAIPGRMALLVTLLLVLINMFNSSVEKEPLTHEITALSGTVKKREIKGHILTLFLICRLVTVLHILCVWCSPCICGIVMQEVQYQKRKRGKSFDSSIQRGCLKSIKPS